MQTRNHCHYFSGVWSEGADKFKNALPENMKKSVNQIVTIGEIQCHINSGGEVIQRFTLIYRLSKYKYRYHTPRRFMWWSFNRNLLDVLYSRALLIYNQ